MRRKKQITGIFPINRDFHLIAVRRNPLPVFRQMSVLDNTIVCSDANGNLNFIYNASPSIVLNRNYQQMAGPVPAGNNIFLGKPLWAKYPGSSSKYFVFYPTATITTYKADLKYCVIDMSLNGGLGQVLTMSDR
ncbi:MAG: hypothetical protein IPL50_09470 [Chitinophagaceae bacterium]|nr:hypothetical protein [Chitinophagaceae bacterium]